eukprot:5158560-Alexandrium_andersonii.AAC.1
MFGRSPRTVECCIAKGRTGVRNRGHCLEQGVQSWGAQPTPRCNRPRLVEHPLTGVKEVIG